MYSAEDELTDFEKLETLIEQRKKKQRNKVEGRKFAKSKHVSHFRSHEVEYEKCVDDFIESLRKAPPSTALVCEIPPFRGK